MAGEEGEAEVSANRALMKHEAAHGLGSLISGATHAVIEEDGQFWKTTPVWPQGAQPDELATMMGYLAGPICYPASASGEDRFLMAVFRRAEPELFAKIERLASEVILPAVEGIPLARLDEWVSKVEAGERVFISRTDSN